jgi:hypothetical protein
MVFLSRNRLILRQHLKLHQERFLQTALEFIIHCHLKKTFDAQNSRVTESLNTPPGDNPIAVNKYYYYYYNSNNNK